MRVLFFTFLYDFSHPTTNRKTNQQSQRNDNKACQKQSLTLGLRSFISLHQFDEPNKHQEQRDKGNQKK